MKTDSQIDQSATEPSPPAKPKRWGWFLLIGLGVIVVVVGYIIIKNLTNPVYTVSDPQALATPTIAQVQTSTPITTSSTASASPATDNTTLAPTINGPAPTDLLTQAARFMDKVQSLHMTLQIRQGKVQVNGADVKAVDGDLQQPDRYQAKVQVQILIASFDLPVIGLDGQQYMKDELGHWQTSNADQTVKLSALLDKTAGLGPTLSKLQNPRLIGLETIDGASTYHVQGTLNGSDITTITFNKLGSQPVTLDVWLDTAKAGQIDQFALKETTGGSNAAWWVTHFSNFDETINIQKPAS